jgi:uncharacterized protein YbjT (DUF2867 family)
LAKQIPCVSVGRRVVGADGVRWDFTGASPPLPACDAAICALGTTLSKAGSQQAFRAVDHDAVLAFASAALAAGARRFVLVSSAGANPNARGFYLRVKGEAEAALAGLPFGALHILRPGLLLGHRAEARPAEAIARAAAPLLNLALRGSLSRFRAIPAAEIANAAVACAIDRTTAGTHVLHYEQLHSAI